MKRLLSKILCVVALSVFCLSTTAFAGDAKPADTQQQPADTKQPDGDKSQEVNDLDS